MFEGQSLGGNTHTLGSQEAVSLTGSVKTGPQSNSSYKEKFNSTPKESQTDVVTVGNKTYDFSGVGGVENYNGGTSDSLYDFSSYIDDDDDERKGRRSKSDLGDGNNVRTGGYTQPTGTGAERFHLGYTPEEISEAEKTMRYTEDQALGNAGIEIGGRIYKIDPEDPDNPDVLLRQRAQTDRERVRKGEFEKIYRKDGDIWNSERPPKEGSIDEKIDNSVFGKLMNKVGTAVNKAADNLLTSKKPDSTQNNARQASETLTSLRAGYKEQKDALDKMKADVEANGYTETPGITKAEEDALKAKAAEEEETKETESATSKAEPVTETPTAKATISKWAELLGEDSISTEEDPETGEVKITIKDPTPEENKDNGWWQKRLDAFDEISRATGEVWNDPNSTIGQKIATGLDALVRYRDAMKEGRVTDSESVAKNLGEIIKDLLGIGADVLTMPFNALKTVLEMILNGKESDLTIDEVWAMLHPGKYEKPDRKNTSQSPEDLDRLVKGYDPSNAANNLDYNKGLTAKSDEKVKGYIRTIVRGQPHVRNLANKLRK